MISEHASLQEVREKIVSREEYHPFPRYHEREQWAQLPEEVRNFYLSCSDEILNYEIPVIKASEYLAYARTNTAPVHAQKWGEIHRMLMKAVLAECIEGKGRYIDAIIDLIWDICEKSSWVGPAHNNHMHNYMWSGVIKNKLPDVTDFNFIDLGAGFTCGILSLTYYFLKDLLDKESPLVCKRIELEIMKRIVIPFMNHDDMTWCGFYGHKINNWNPWILSNILLGGLIVIKDPDLRTEFIARCMEKIDIYVKQCPADGGCDEGPEYWTGAGGTTYDFIEILYGASNGKLNFFHEPLIKNIGEYMMKANVREREYINFADNGHNVNVDWLRLYRFGKNVCSEQLVHFAADRFTLDIERIRKADFVALFYCNIKNFFTIKDLLAEPKGMYEPKDAFLPDTQILYVRDNKNQLTAAAKGGFNNESHNHNDLGHFICSYEGEQIFVDLGLLPYTAITFSPYRYTIWILQSAYHNCAKLNGFDQHDGDNYRAKFLSESLDEKKGTYSIELKGAYEEKAGIESYVRSFVMDKVNSVWTVTDHVEMKKETKEIDFHYITICEPKLCGDHFEITLRNGHTVKVEFDAEHYDFSVDTHSLEQEYQKRQWNAEQAYRVHLTPKAAGKVFDSYIKVSAK